MSANDGYSQLAMLKALADEVNEALKCGAGGLRDEADEHFMAGFERTGDDRKRIRVNGQEVGTMSVRAKKAVSRREPRYSDFDAFLDWLTGTEDGRAAVRRLACSKPNDALRCAVADGVLPEGVEVAEVEEPARTDGTTLRVDADKVRDAMGVPHGRLLLHTLLGDPLAIEGEVGEGEEEPTYEA